MSYLSDEEEIEEEIELDLDVEVTEETVVRGLGSGLDAEAKRVLEESPKFEPGKQRGRLVKVRMVIPIAFNLDN